MKNKKIRMLIIVISTIIIILLGIVAIRELKENDIQNSEKQSIIEQIDIITNSYEMDINSVVLEKNETNSSEYNNVYDMTIDIAELESYTYEQLFTIDRTFGMVDQISPYNICYISNGNEYSINCFLRTVYKNKIKIFQDNNPNYYKYSNYGLTTDINDEGWINCFLYAKTVVESELNPPPYNNVKLRFPRDNNIVTRFGDTYVIQSTVKKYRYGEDNQSIYKFTVITKRNEDSTLSTTLCLLKFQDLVKDDEKIGINYW